MKNPVLRATMGGLALFSLAACLGLALLIFLGRVSDATYKKAFLAASVLWFVFSILRGRRAQSPAAAERQPMP
jgi:hypothetical protein